MRIVLLKMLNVIQGVPLPTKPGSSLIILLQTHSDTYRHNFTTDTFLLISHTTNVLLFKSCCNIFIGFGIIKELPGLVGSGTLCIIMAVLVWPIFKFRCAADLIVYLQHQRLNVGFFYKTFATFFPRCIHC